jgi:hypothetical protein
VAEEGRVILFPLSESMVLYLKHSYTPVIIVAPNFLVWVQGDIVHTAIFRGGRTCFFQHMWGNNINKFLLTGLIAYGVGMEVANTRPYNSLKPLACGFGGSVWSIPMN